MGARAWALLLALAAIWGASYLLIKIGLRDLSPAAVAFARVTLAAALLLPFAFARGLLTGLRSRAGWLAATALIQVAAPFLLIAAGETEISSGLAGTLVAATPILTVLLAIRIDQSERAEGRQWAGIATGIAGVAILLGLEVSGSLSELAGGLAVVLASLGYAIGGFIVKHRLSDVPPLGVVSAVMTLSALILLGPAIAGLPGEMPRLGPALAVAALGIAGTGVAFLIFYTLIAEIGAARSTLVTYMAPGFAVIYGAVLLDEHVSVAIIAGLTLVVAGSWVAATPAVPRAAPPSSPGGRRPSA